MEQGQRQKRTFRKYSYRGIDLDNLVDMQNEDLMALFRARQRRKFSRGIKRQPITLLKKLRKSKKACAYGDKPVPVKTHMRNMVIVPEMIGHYLAEFSITYHPVQHGRSGKDAKSAMKF